MNSNRERFDRFYLKNKDWIFFVTRNNPELASGMYKSSLIGLHMLGLDERVLQHEDSMQKGKIKVIGAAGFDKDANVPLRVYGNLGYDGFVFGTATFDPRSGNGKPRIWRFPVTETLANYMGLNNDGAEIIGRRLDYQDNPFSLDVIASVAANPIYNDNFDRSNEDLSKTVRVFADVDKVGAIEYNASCPNTVVDIFETIEHICENLNTISRYKRPDQKIRVKLSPDYDLYNLEMLYHEIDRSGVDVSTLVTGNTSSDHDPRYIDMDILGGMSGRGLGTKSFRLQKMVGIINDKCDKDYDISLSGSIFSDTVRGRVLHDGTRNYITEVQVGTGLIYEGTKVIRDIKKELKDV